MSRAKQYVTHTLGECRDCDWTTEDHIRGRDKARNHHKKTGHCVVIEVGFWSEYGNKSEGECDDK